MCENVPVSGRGDLSELVANILHTATHITHLDLHYFTNDMDGAEHGQTMLESLHNNNHLESQRIELSCE